MSASHFEHYNWLSLSLSINKRYLLFLLSLSLSLWGNLHLNYSSFPWLSASRCRHFNFWPMPFGSGGDSIATVWSYLLDNQIAIQRSTAWCLWFKVDISAAISISAWDKRHCSLRVREFILVYNLILLLLYRMSTGLSSLATAASGCKLYWSHLRKVLDWSDTPGAVTETKYSLISSFTFLLYDHGKIGISSPNHLLVLSTLYLTAITFDAEVRSHITKPGILFWSVCRAI